MNQTADESIRDAGSVALRQSGQSFHLPAPPELHIVGKFDLRPSASESILHSLHCCENTFRYFGRYIVAGINQLSNVVL